MDLSARKPPVGTEASKPPAGAHGPLVQPCVIQKIQKSTTRFEYKKGAVSLDFTISKLNAPFFIDILKEALKDLESFNQ